MEEDRTTRITRMLQAAENGEGDAGAELLSLLYDELRSMARARMRALPPGNTLQPTALVHEAYLRMVRGAGLEGGGRRHFFAAATRAMCDILVEQARRKGARKHGGGLGRVDAEAVERVSASESSIDDALALAEALHALEDEYPRKAQVVMLRHYGGLNHPEIAEMLEISLPTVERDWRFASAWLKRALGGSGDAP